MNSLPTVRHCRSCGAIVTGDGLCAGCSLAGAFGTLGFDPPETAVPSSVPFSPLDLPCAFAHYRVERAIAAGGMGMVYEAEDVRLNRTVALKMLREVFFATEQDRLRFQAEAEMASQLDHAHIVPIHDVGEHAGQPYFTMKFIRGTNLADLLEKGPLLPREAATLMAKVARAVHHAHQHGVLHRDLKPANILLDRQGEPWLTDFGIAKLLHFDSGLTLTQAIAGTPGYMSPEQASGRRGETTTASDVWSLGVLLYQMLTGELPFPGGSYTEVARCVAEREPVPPARLRRGLSPDLETVCLRCLAKEQARRLPGAGALADELERWLRGEPIHSRPITSLERLGKWMRRHPYRAAVVSAFTVLVLGAATAITWQWRRAEANAVAARTSADRAQRVAYSATLAQALGAQERHAPGSARRLLESLAPEDRGFDWHLVAGFCRGDDLARWQLGRGEGDIPDCLTVLPDGRNALISADGRLHLRAADGTPDGPPRVLPAPPGQDVQRCYGLTFSPSGQRLAYGRGDVLRVLDAGSLAVLYEEDTLRPQFGWLEGERLLYGFNGSVAGPPSPGAWILDFSQAAGAGEIPRVPLAASAPLAVSADRRFFALTLVNTAPDSWRRWLHVYAADADPASLPPAVYEMPGAEYPGVLAFSPHGRFLAFSAGMKEKRTARVLDLTSREIIFDCEFRFPVNALAIDPDEKLLGVAGVNSVVRLYDFSRGRAAAGENTYDDGVDRALCQPVARNGAGEAAEDLLTRSAQDGRARFFFGHEEEVLGIAFPGQGRFLTAGADGTVRQWSTDVPRPGLRLAPERSTYDLWHPAASRDGRFLLVTDGQRALWGDVRRSRESGGAAMQMLMDPDEPARGSRENPLAVLADGRPVTQSRVSGAVTIWHFLDGRLQPQRTIAGAVKFWHDGKTYGGSLSRDEKRLAGVLAGQVFCVDLETSTDFTWSGYLGYRVSLFASVALSPDGNWVASSQFGPRVTIHPFGHPEQITATLGGAPRAFDTAIAFSPDSRRLYTGNEDGRIRVWDTATWRELPALGFRAHNGPVTAIAVSHDQTLLATSGGGTLKLFPADPEPGETYRRERITMVRDLPANWIQFAADENGHDSALLHSAPGRTLEVWEGAVK